MFSTDLQKHLVKFILYRSLSRGTCTQDSDRDQVALVDEKTPIIDRALKDINYRGMWDYDFNPVISLKGFTEIHFPSVKERGTSFCGHVETKVLPT